MGDVDVFIFAYDKKNENFVGQASLSSSRRRCLFVVSIWLKRRIWIAKKTQEHFAETAENHTKKSANQRLSKQEKQVYALDELRQKTQNDRTHEKKV